MIIVSVTLHSARDGSKTELARMEIANDGTGTLECSNYDARTLRGRSTKALDARQQQRATHIKEWPRQRFHVWNLVALALAKMGYGAQEKAGA